MTHRTARSAPLAPVRPGTGRLACRLGSVLLALAVGGCLTPAAPPDEGAPAAAAGTRVAAPPGPSLVPAPELFAAEAWASWDGMQTLGGIWVALPEIDRARRVRLTNVETGTMVDGALIRRDPGQPGPRLLISSEAANALGIRPNNAVGMQIVALVHQAAAPHAPEGEAVAAGDDAGDNIAARAEAGSLPEVTPEAQRVATRDAETEAPADAGPEPAERAAALVMPVPRPVRRTAEPGRVAPAVPAGETPVDLQGAAPAQG